MEIYSDCEFANITYHHEDHFILYKWKTSPTQAEFKVGCENLLAAIQYYKCGRSLIDTRQMGAVHPDVVEWMTSDWIARAATKGYTHAAVILPVDIFASMSVDEIVTRVNDLVTHRNFDNVQKAIFWIKSIGSGNQ